MDVFLKALTPAIVYGLGLVCPAVPSIVWTALVNAILSGDITVAHLQQFLKDHPITSVEDTSPNENAKGQANQQ